MDSEPDSESEVSLHMTGSFIRSVPYETPWCEARAVTDRNRSLITRSLPFVGARPAKSDPYRTRARNPRSPSPSPSPICRGSGVGVPSPICRGSRVHHPHPRFPSPIGAAGPGVPCPAGPILLIRNQSKLSSITGSPSSLERNGKYCSQHPQLLDDELVKGQDVELYRRTAECKLEQRWFQTPQPTW
jgi:hypothetical protein